jgi:serine/threonine-protein kinase
MLCPSCRGENDEAAEVCFHCRAVLLAVTRGAVIASRYEVRSPIGRGGMGEVYRAYDRVLEEEVALKVLRAEDAGAEDWARRFRSEIRLARKVTHANVCRIHDYGEEGCLRWLSMELVRGENLKQALARRGALPPAEAYEVAIQAAEGLTAIHAAGIVHRDLKTLNLMVDGAGKVRVMDFGIAKPAAEGATDGGVTGYILGSPEYMSPEQARGRAVDLRSDLYSLGIVIYELFTGAVPFRADTPVTTLLLHLETEPPLDHPGLPPALRPVLERCLAKDPAARFGSARDLVDALESARRGEKATARTRRAPSRAVVGLTAAVLAVAAGIALVGQRSGPASTPPSAEPPSTTAESTLPAPPPTAPGPSPSVPPAERRTNAPGRTAPTPTPSPTEATTASPIASLPLVVPTPTPTPSSTPTPSPSPAKPAEGSLLVVVTPWADVSIDDVPVGQTPLKALPLPPGPHSVLLTHPNYQPFPRRVTIRSGETFRLEVNLSSDGVRRSP